MVYNLVTGVFIFDFCWKKIFFGDLPKNSDFLLTHLPNLSAHFIQPGPGNNAPWLLPFQWLNTCNVYRMYICRFSIKFSTEKRVSCYVDTAV